MTLSELFSRFVTHMNQAGFEPQPYRGRWFYDGPAVWVDSPEDLQAAIRATCLPLQWDQCGKDGFIVYPSVYGKAGAVQTH